MSGKRRAAGRPGGESIVPLTPDRWDDFVALFGPRGACGGCWCMAWRLSSREFEAQKGDANRRAMQQLVKSKTAPGLLAYQGGVPVGWVSVAPRGEFRRLAGSRVLKPLDQVAVWSVSCLFLAKSARRQGLSSRLLRAAAAFAFEHGAPAVEGYPVIPKQPAMPDVFAWTGIEASFRKAGWKRAGSWSSARPIWRQSAPRHP
jgi:GNAT superfamily N-acetyltransferase